MTELSLTVTAPDHPEMYSVDQIPGGETRVVQLARANVLKNIDLSLLVKGLSRCSSLIYLAFNGVAGHKDLTVGMTRLHDRFGKVCGNCEAELNVFVNQSRQIQHILLDAFTFLYDGDIAFAVETMKTCSKAARELSARANNLAGNFERLGEETVELLSKTELAKGASEEQRKAVQRKIAELEAQTVKARRLHEEIVNKKKKYERMYRDAAVKAEEATDRAMTMSILSSLIEPISAGIGSALAIYSGGAVTGAIGGITRGLQGGGASGGVSEAERVRARDEAETAWKNAETEAQEALLALEPARKAHDEASRLAQQGQEALTRARQALEAAVPEQQAKLKAALDTAESTARVQKTRADKAGEELDRLTQAHKEKQSQAAARKQAYDQAVERVNAGNGPDKGKDSLDKIAGDLRKEKNELFRLLQQKEDEETGSIREMQDCAIQIGLSRTESDSLDVAVNSLYLAIGALRKVVVVLRMAKQFWDQMATACEQLSDTTLESKLKLLAGKDFEQCRRIIHADRFKLEVVGYYAAWKAIEVVCTEYSAEAAKIQSRVFHDFSQNLTTEERQALARTMSEQLVEEAGQENEENLLAKQQLEQAIRETEEA